jgi:hypothetical protein
VLVLLAGAFAFVSAMVYLGDAVIRSRSSTSALSQRAR